MAINDRPCTFSLEEMASGACCVKLNDKSFTGEVVLVKQNNCTVCINGNTYQFTIDEEQVFERKQKFAPTEDMAIGQVKAPLPGKICEVLVSEEMQVNVGDPLVILEAMKMHNEIASPVTGKVVKVFVKDNEPVSGGQILIELKSEDTLP